MFEVKTRVAIAVIEVDLESQAKGLCKLKPGITDYIYNQDSGKYAVLYFEES